MNRINAPMNKHLESQPKTSDSFVSKFVYPVVKFPLRFPRLAACREALRFGGIGPAQRSRRARGWVILYTGFTECIHYTKNPVYSTGEYVLYVSCLGKSRITERPARCKELNVVSGLPLAGGSV